MAPRTKTAGTKKPKPIVTAANACKSGIKKRPIGKRPKLSPTRQDYAPITELSPSPFTPTGIFPFTQLPSELQLKIYEFAAILPEPVLVKYTCRTKPAALKACTRKDARSLALFQEKETKYYIQQRKTEHRTAFSLAMTCRMIRADFSKIYYRSNIFHFETRSAFTKFVRIIGSYSSVLARISIDLGYEITNFRVLASLPNVHVVRLVEYPTVPTILPFFPRDRRDSGQWKELVKVAQRGLEYLVANCSKKLERVEILPIQWPYGPRFGNAELLFDMKESMSNRRIAELLELGP